MNWNYLFNWQRTVTTSNEATSIVFKCQSLYEKYSKTNDQIFKPQTSLPKITSATIEKNATEFCNLAKYNLFNHLWENQENLKLIEVFKTQLKTVDDEILQLNQKILNYNEEMKNSPQSSNLSVVSSDDLCSNFNFLVNKTVNDVTNLETIRKNMLVVWNNYIKKWTTFKTDINERIKKLREKNKKLLDSDLFLSTIINDDIVVNFLTLFQSLKTNKDTYNFDLKLQEIQSHNSENSIDDYFTVIENIFYRLLKPIFEIEEKLFSLFTKRTQLQLEFDKKQTEINKKITEIDNKVTDLNTAKNKIELDIEKLKEQQKLLPPVINNLENRKKNIKRKIKTFQQDSLENGGDIEEYDNEEIYLNSMQTKIEHKKQELDTLDTNLNLLNNRKMLMGAKLKGFENSRKFWMEKSKKNTSLYNKKVDKLKKSEATKYAKLREEINKCKEIFSEQITRLEEQKLTDDLSTWWENPENKIKISSLNSECKEINNVEEIAKLIQENKDQIKILFEKIKTDFKNEEQVVWEALKKEFPDMKQDETLQTYKEEKNSLAALLTKLTSENDQLEGRIQEIKKEKDQFKRTIQELKQENDQFKGTIQELKKPIQQLKKPNQDGSLDVLRKLYEKLEDKCDILKQSKDLKVSALTNVINFLSKKTPTEQSVELREALSALSGNPNMGKQMQELWLSELLLSELTLQASEVGISLNENFSEVDLKNDDFISDNDCPTTMEEWTNEDIKLFVANVNKDYSEKSYAESSEKVYQPTTTSC